jgi:hypothetical protein
LVAALRGVTARVGRGGSLVELGKCVEHGLHPPIRMTPKHLTSPCEILNHRMIA